MPATKHSRHEVADFSGQDEHCCPTFEFAIVNSPACMMFTSFKILPNYPSTSNAQRTGELGHEPLPRTVLFGLY